MLNFKRLFQTSLVVAFSLLCCDWPGFFTSRVFAQVGQIRLDIAPRPKPPDIDFDEQGIVVFDLNVNSDGTISEATLVGGTPTFIERSRLALEEWRFRVPPGISPPNVSAIFVYRPRPDVNDSPYVFNLPVPDSYDDAHQTPFPLRIVDPGYPHEGNGEGTTVLQLEITPQGEVYNTQTIVRAGNLSATAAAATRRWRFHVPGPASPQLAIVVMNFQKPKYAR